MACDHIGMTEYVQGLDLDSPGALSVVVQGKLDADNLTETAGHCRHWRDLFPTAQIILSISITDLFADAVGPCVLGDLPLAPAYRDDGAIRMAVRALRRDCDKIVLADVALPLPPIKTIVSTPNNINLQIAAAKIGLAEATGVYVLRVRSDLVFVDRTFIRQYRESSNCYARGSSAIFAERVLISPLYTLNPFTFERMPFHFSDWFHFGRTIDVRMIWTIPEMSYADSVYFKTHRSRKGSTLDERLFLPRLAIEQHIVFHCFKDLLPGLSLNYLNDPSSIDQSLDVLSDNFIICDLVEAGCVFDKYQSEFDRPSKALHCVNRDDWTVMASANGAARRDVLERKRDGALYPERLPFPRKVPTSALSVKIGQHNQGDIIAWSASGVLFHGPYDTLPRGTYLATVHLALLKGPGSITVRTTLNGGEQLLAEQHFTAGLIPQQEIALPFEISADRGAGFEVVVEVHALVAIAVSGITIARYPLVDGAPLRLAWRDDVAQVPLITSSLQTAVGLPTSRGVQARGRTGILAYGSCTALDAGAYRIEIAVCDSLSAGRSFVEVTTEDGKRILSKKKIQDEDFTYGTISCDFVLDVSRQDIEFRLIVDRGARFSILQGVVHRLHHSGNLDAI